MMILIDTDILIDVTKEVSHAIQRLTEEAEKAIPIISSITRKELLMGCRNKEEAAKMLNFLTRFHLQRLTPAIDATADRLLETYYLIPFCVPESSFEPRKRGPRFDHFRTLHHDLKSIDDRFLDGLEGMEKPIGKPPFPEALPKVLNGMELGRIWRK